MVKRFIRDQDGRLRHDPTEIFPTIKSYYDHSSSGLYTYAHRYIKVLISLTRNYGELHRRGRLKWQPDVDKWLPEKAIGSLRAFLVPDAPAGALEMNRSLAGPVCLSGLE
jgi:hypothetical protein